MEQIIFNSIILLAIVYVGYMQHKQNKSQNELLTALEKYSKIMDVDKLRDYVKIQEEAAHSKALTLIEHALREQIHSEQFQKILRTELDGKINPALMELILCAGIYLATLSQDERRKYLSKMIHSKEAMTALLNLSDSMKGLSDVLKEIQKEKQLKT